MMGYESKLYIVDKSTVKQDEGYWAEVIATYDMCKFNAFDGVFKMYTDCYVYADDGNTAIVEDRYGDRLKEAQLQDVIEHLQECIKLGDNYRRIKPLLALLESFDLSEWHNLVVLHYGY